MFLANFPAIVIRISFRLNFVNELCTILAYESYNFHPREQLEKARMTAANQGFIRLAGSVKGPKNLSSRKGFSRA